MAESDKLCFVVNDQPHWVRYPRSPAMKSVLSNVFKGHEYPQVLPKSFRPSLIVDVGGNVGAAAIWFHVNYPDAQIISFEPSTSLFEYLSSNTADYSQISVNNLGLADHDGQIDLHTSNISVAQNSLAKHPTANGAVESVKICRASTAFESLEIEKVSILKIDTEGCEVPILRDLGDRLDDVDAVYVEYHSEQDRRDIDGMMSKCFYLIHASVHHPNLGTMVFFSKRATEQTKKYVSPPLQV